MPRTLCFNSGNCRSVNNPHFLPTRPPSPSVLLPSSCGRRGDIPPVPSRCKRTDWARSSWAGPRGTHPLPHPLVLYLKNGYRFFWITFLWWLERLFFFFFCESKIFLFCKVSKYKIKLARGRFLPYIFIVFTNTLLTAACWCPNADKTHKPWSSVTFTAGLVCMGARTSGISVSHGYPWHVIPLPWYHIFLHPEKDEHRHESNPIQNPRYRSVYKAQSSWISLNIWYIKADNAGARHPEPPPLYLFSYSLVLIHAPPNAQNHTAIANKTENPVCCHITPLRGSTRLTLCSQSANGDWHHCVVLPQRYFIFTRSVKRWAGANVSVAELKQSTKLLQVPQSEPENFSGGEWKCHCLPKKEMALHVSLFEKKKSFDFGVSFWLFLVRTVRIRQWQNLPWPARSHGCAFSGIILQFWT